MDIKENAAYIKGLCDGLELDTTTKEGKVISAILDLMQKLADRVVDLENECNELREYVEEIDEDLGYVEEDLYVDEEDDEDDEDDFDSDFEDAFDNDFEDDSEYDEFVCPACGEIVCISDTLDIADVVCPACGEKFGDVEICDGNCNSCEGCDEE